MRGVQVVLRAVNSTRIDTLCPPAPFVVAAVALFLAALLLTADARAQQCPAGSGISQSVSQIDAQQRLDWIHRRIRHGSRRSTIWASLWGSTYATIASAQAVRAIVSDNRVDRIEGSIAAGSALLGSAVILFLRPTLIADRIRLDSRIVHRRPSDDPCALLAEAERMLERDAANQAFSIGPLMQTVSIAYNIGLGLLFGLWLDDWVAGGITIAAGLAGTEGMMLTRPTDAIDAWRRYRIGDLRSEIRPSTSYWVVAPDIAPEHVGVRFVVTSM